MITDSQLPDRRYMLERRRQFAKLLYVLRHSRRFVLQPASYAVQNPLSFGRANHAEVTRHANGESELVHAYTIADAHAVGLSSTTMRKDDVQRQMRSSIKRQLRASGITGDAVESLATERQGGSRAACAARKATTRPRHRGSSSAARACSISGAALP